MIFNQVNAQQNVIMEPIMQQMSAHLALQIAWNVEMLQIVHNVLMVSFLKMVNALLLAKGLHFHIWPWTKLVSPVLKESHLPSPWVAHIAIKLEKLHVFNASNLPIMLNVWINDFNEIILSRKMLLIFFRKQPKHQE